MCNYLFEYFLFKVYLIALPRILRLDEIIFSIKSLIKPAHNIN